MPKSSAVELAALRGEVFERDGGCVWPGCALGLPSYDKPASQYSVADVLAVLDREET
jgi:hypothetical protein